MSSASQQSPGGSGGFPCWRQGCCRPAGHRRVVKGDDYKMEEVVGREIVEGYGGKVALVPIVKGLSTSSTVDKILQANRGN